MSADPKAHAPQRVRLLEVDLLRFLAALAVVLFHYTGSRGGPFEGEKARELFRPISALTQFGYLGVELFFLISGFVILMSVWGRSMADFAVSRIIRLYPAYWFAVLLIGVIYYTTGLGWGEVETIIPNLTMFQQGMGVRNASNVFWTLWTEMHFYALISILVLAGVTYQRCITFMATWSVASVFAHESDSKVAETLLIPEYAPFFIAGMAFYLIHRFGSSLLLWLFVGFSWACAVRYAVPAAIEKAYRISPADARPAVAIIVTLTFAVMALVATGKLGWLRWRFFTTLGCLTYPVYLIHYDLAPVLARVLYPAMAPWAATVTIIMVVLVAAYAVHKLVEQPLAAWLKPRLRESFAKLQMTDTGRRRGRRARASGGAPDDPAAGTPHTNESEVAPLPARTLPQPGEEPHGSAPSAPIGSTI
ncbi:acyltransferase family protein [Spirillospora sp. NPDC048911]|uniref:acyltransferase family protein n=1 Tax=Spirillospora sp. NPDC048911 TaxID=3364527 RepID=UPI00372230AF